MCRPAECIYVRECVKFATNSWINNSNSFGCCEWYQLCNFLNLIHKERWEIIVFVLFQPIFKHWCYTCAKSLVKKRLYCIQ